jgi:predicted dehydrogenase
VFAASSWLAEGTVPNEVGIGIVGYGAMGRAHAYAYHVAPQVRSLPVRPRLRLISGRSRAAVESAARAYGIDGFTTDWREIVDRQDIDVVDVCTPPGTHAEIVEAAAAAGKAILCEKPLATDLALARRAVEAARFSARPHAIGFNYRRLPALSLMKRLVDGGAIGEVRLWRGTWLSDEFVDPSTPFDWRFERALGGTTIADLGSHLIDLALWTAGAVESVSAQSTTFIGERIDPATMRPRAVEIDDASSALFRFERGALGVLEVARACPRRPCDFTVELSGSTGTLSFSYARLNELWYGSTSDPDELYGLRRIRAEHTSHPYAGDWWPIGQGIGYGESFVNQAADHLERWPDGPWTPDLGQALRVQEVCEAMELAASEQRRVTLAEVSA